MRLLYTSEHKYNIMPTVGRMKLLLFCRSVAVYISILQRIITRDLPQFIVVMVVVLIAFGGGVYFALRGEKNPSNEDEPGSTSDDFDPVYDTGLGIFPDDTR